MSRRAFARHRAGAALLLGLSLRAQYASAEPAKPDETRVGTLEGKAADALPRVIHLGSIDGVGLYRGGYPVRSELAFSGAASLRSFDARGLIETPFARGLGSLLPALSFLLGPEVKLDYRRYQARANHEPSARDRFSELGAGSYVLPGEKSIGILSRLGDACRPKITLTW